MEKIPLPNTFELNEVGANRAELVIKPLFAGYGTTIGNALRRVLLSSIPGAAIKTVKIKGVDHEFSTMKGVKEDVVDILLNIKKLRLKVHGEEEVRLTLKVKGKKTVTAGDIEANASVEIANPDLVLATLSGDDTEFEMELVADRGRGYMPTETRNEEKKEIGMIAVDAIYTPVKNVGLSVENVRVGQMTTFEQVTLDIETDGIVSPKEAVSYASQILVDHFQLLLDSDLEPQTQRTDLEQPVMDSDETIEEAEEDAPKKRGRPKKQEEESTSDEEVEVTE